MNYEVIFSKKHNKKYLKYLNDEQENPFNLITIAIYNCIRDEFLGKPYTFDTLEKMKNRKKELLKFIVSSNIIYK
jgi:hypothetical protein